MGLNWNGRIRDSRVEGRDPADVLAEAIGESLALTLTRSRFGRPGATIQFFLERNPEYWEPLRRLTSSDVATARPA